jgi:2-polyprenyl-6-methoxyphenol hydroxylase-like FAD-dependent oxidoreductase
LAAIPKVLQEHINTAYPAHVCLIGTTLPDGYAQITPRGSTMVYDDEHFALWERGKGSTTGNLTDGTKVTIYFRKPPLREQGLLPRVKTREGVSSAVSAAYMVGCDGGNSLVRRHFDIKLNGEANIQQLRQALYYCDDLYERIPIGKGRHYHVADAEGSFLIVQDSTRHFTLQSVGD